MDIYEYRKGREKREKGEKFVRGRVCYRIVAAKGFTIDIAALSRDGGISVKKNTY